MKLYIINLKSAVERRTILEKDLLRHGLAAEFISAINGNSLSEDNVQDILREQFNKPAFNDSDPLSRKLGTLGCIMSHVKTWITFLESEHQVACICEDDIKISENLNYILSALDSNMHGYDDVRLIHLSPWSLNYSTGCETAMSRGSTLGRGYKLKKPVRMPGSNAGYVINRKAAEQYLKYIMPFRAQADYFTGASGLWGVKTGVITPPLELNQGQATKSSIGQVENTNKYDIVTHDQLGTKPRRSLRDRLFEIKIKTVRQSLYLEELKPLKEAASSEKVSRIKKYLV